MEFRRRAATVGPWPNVTVTAGGRGDISVTHDAERPFILPIVLPDDSPGSRFEGDGLKAPVRGEDEAKAAKASHLPGRIQMAPTRQRGYRCA